MIRAAFNGGSLLSRKKPLDYGPLMAVVEDEHPPPLEEGARGNVSAGYDIATVIRRRHGEPHYSYHKVHPLEVWDYVAVEDVRVLHRDISATDAGKRVKRDQRDTLWRRGLYSQKTIRANH